MAIGGPRRGTRAQRGRKHTRSREHFAGRIGGGFAAGSTSQRWHQRCSPSTNAGRAFSRVRGSGSDGSFALVARKKAATNKKRALSAATSVVMRGTVSVRHGRTITTLSSVVSVMSTIAPACERALARNESADATAGGRMPRPPAESATAPSTTRLPRPDLLQIPWPLQTVLAHAIGADFAAAHRRATERARGGRTAAAHRAPTERLADEAADGVMQTLLDRQIALPANAGAARRPRVHSAADRRVVGNHNRALLREGTFQCSLRVVSRAA